jgi:hypothetical protein
MGAAPGPVPGLPEDDQIPLVELEGIAESPDFKVIQGGRSERFDLALKEIDLNTAAKPTKAEIQAFRDKIPEIASQETMQAMYLDLGANEYQAELLAKDSDLRNRAALIKGFSAGYPVNVIAEYIIRTSPLPLFNSRQEMIETFINVGATEEDAILISKMDNIEKEFRRRIHEKAETKEAAANMIWTNVLAKLAKEKQVGESWMNKNDQETTESGDDITKVSSHEPNQSTSSDSMNSRASAEKEELEMLRELREDPEGPESYNWELTKPKPWAKGEGPQWDMGTIVKSATTRRVNLSQSDLVDPEYLVLPEDLAPDDITQPSHEQSPPPPREAEDITHPSPPGPDDATLTNAPKATGEQPPDDHENLPRRSA